MVLCMVVGCGNRSGRDKGIYFARVPSVVTNQGEEAEILSQERRSRWISAISRADLTDEILYNDRVCGRHFVSGQAAKAWDRYNVDWVPSLNLGHDKKIDKTNLEQASQRGQRASEKERKRKEQQERERALAEEIAAKKRRLNEPGGQVSDIPFENELPTHADASSQTDEFEYLFSAAPKERPFDESDFRNNDKKEFVLTLMKLKLNMPLEDLAYRFNVSVSTISRVFLAWMVAMDTRLSPLIKWPDREDLWRTMPQCFQFSFGKKTTVIIDCFEVFIDRPSNLLARAQTFSSYKHHNTIKVLIGITPQGTISFVSKAWGGRTSDKFLTENCGIMEKLLPGDLVMADRGFTIHEFLVCKQAELAIPAFTRGKDQLDPVDVEKTRGIANVRIHVERVIGLLRRKYTILSGTLPIDYLFCNQNGSQEAATPMIDRIINVSSALVNLCPGIVPLD
ncbi:hypothetical protein AWC38_SpisGene17387 [Stylophora pistillata]|uniref:THAP-type domain-containing protein n=1 Tax=Stylophora pistillata TaxID=50429 RepID=A0A2B4R914_STYPI|nr:hypothetical protein AWC38_SpisGene20981 [Stylophora pistillata]PFX14834.1 hypothetical protein AWC38_SpisGene20983 [Stylophora pistillata]PFX18241.1 hypothetical protein AWC38_SpisGene17387 [Stylophora pistillata]